MLRLSTPGEPMPTAIRTPSADRRPPEQSAPPSSTDSTSPAEPVSPSSTPRAGPPDPPDSLESVNEVHLLGRVGADPVVRVLPSGDELVQLRLVVARPRPGRTAAGRRRPGVDTLDLACWSSTARRAASRLTEGTTIEVWGALRRRFFRAEGGGPQSRYEVEVTRIRRVRR